MSYTTIKPCHCENEGQDRLHGKGRRVHNFAHNDDKWRCTVCSDKKSGSRSDREKI